MAAKNNFPKEKLRTEAVRYMLNNGSTSKYDLAKHLSLGTTEVDRMMRGSWNMRFLAAAGSEYVIKDAEAAKKYLEIAGM